VNVKCGGQIIPRGKVITPDDVNYSELKKYLISEDDFKKAKGSTVRVLDSVRKQDAEDEDDVPAVNKPSTPAVDADTRTVAELKAELDAKDIPYDPKAKRVDLIALLDAE
jgi:hypothetical protein